MAGNGNTGAPTTGRATANPAPHVLPEASAQGEEAKVEQQGTQLLQAVTLKPSSHSQLRTAHRCRILERCSRSAYMGTVNSRILSMVEIHLRSFGLFVGYLNGAIDYYTRELR